MTTASTNTASISQTIHLNHPTKEDNNTMNTLININSKHTVDRAKAAYVACLTEITNVPEAGLVPVTLDILAITTSFVGIWPELRGLRGQIETTWRGYDFSSFDKLDQYALALLHAHGALYAQQNGWDASFETLVGDICAAFERDFDPSREHCWIAEMDGQRVGSIALARDGEEGVAKLRLLLVEEQARGYGLGSRLVDECHRFARAAGYRKMRLWTTDQQKEARQIYRNKGYQLVGEEPVHAFGQDMVNESWEMDLGPGS